MSKQVSIDEPVILETNTGSIAYITAKVNNKVVGIPILNSSNNSVSLIQPTMNIRLHNSTLYTDEDVKPYTNADGSQLGLAIILKDKVYALPLFQVPENTLDTITLNFTETTFVTGMSSCKSKRGIPLSLIFSINDSNYGMPLFRFTHLYNIQNGKTVEWAKIKPRWYNDKEGDGERIDITDEEKRRRFYPKERKRPPVGYPPGLPHGTNEEPKIPPPPPPPPPPPVPPIVPFYGPYDRGVGCPFWWGHDFIWRAYVFDGHIVQRANPNMPPTNQKISVGKMYHLFKTDLETSPEEAVSLLYSCIAVIENTIPELKYSDIPEIKTGEDMIEVLNGIRETFSDYCEIPMDELTEESLYPDALYQLNILVEDLRYLNTPEFWEYSRHHDGKYAPKEYRPSLSRDYTLPSGIFVYERPTHGQELRWSIKTMLSVGKPTVDFGSDFGSTYLNNKITAYSDLINRIKMQFGWPNVEPDVCDENIAENIDQAIELYSKYAGYTDEYLIFHTRLYKPGVGIRLDKLFSMTPEMYSQAHEGNEIDMDYDVQNYRKVLNCFSVEPGESTGINTLFTLESALAQQTQWQYLLGEGRGFDLTSYAAVKSYLDTRRKVLGQEVYYRFDPYTQYLRILPEPRRLDPYLGLIGCYVEKPRRELIIERWVFEYALALTMVIVGRLRSKYTMTMLGGSTLRGDEILNAGLQAKKELEEQLFRGTGWVESQPTFMVG